MKFALKLVALVLMLTSVSSFAHAQQSDGASPPPPYPMAGQPPMRGQPGSDADLMHRRHELERIIQDLSMDQRDFGGFKERAMQDLNAARQDLIQAEQFAHAHGQ